MLILNSAQVLAIKDAAVALAFDTPECDFTDFIATTLGLTVIQKAEITPSGPAPSEKNKANQIDSIAGKLYASRSGILHDKAEIPNFLMRDKVDPITGFSSYWIGGLGAHLHTGKSKDIIDRLRAHNEIRNYLCAIGDGKYLEALGAGLLSAEFSFSRATQGTGDQGVDIFSSVDVLKIGQWLSSGGGGSAGFREIGHTVHVISSCKANTGNLLAGYPNDLSPAMLREHLGSWLIQRSEHSIWNSRSIKPLSPILLLFITTYRVTDSVRQLASKMGVAIWGIPEIIVMICEKCPATCFDGTGRIAKAGMDAWIAGFHSDRLKSA